MGTAAGVREQRRPSAGRTETVLRDVDTQASLHASRWFPELGSLDRPAVLVGRHERPRCFLYRIRLGGGGATRDVMVKIRHALPELRNLDRGGRGRPALTPERTLPDHEAARQEYDGLRVVASVLASQPPCQFGVLRALAWLPEHAGIVMDHVAEPTLYQVLSFESRFAAARRQPADSSAWCNAGAWLRLFHDARPGHELPEGSEWRLAGADFARVYVENFRADSGDRRLLAGLAAATGHLAASQPAMATGHGDFSMRNVFASPTGRVTVFDPLPVWRVPVYEDLARFLVGMRVTAAQALSYGVAHRLRTLDDHESSFLHGYFGAATVPREQIVGFQALLLMDRWAGTQGKQDRRGGLHPHARTARVRIMNSYYRREAGRLLSLLS